jgi:predicted metal-dependent enzyme (double-stranded beta helix superfamily)
MTAQETAFDAERLVEECRAALAESPPQKAVREIVGRAVSDGASVRRALGDPVRAGVEKLYQSEELTVLNVVWGPEMHLLPHDHQMWAVIGVYDGREDNIFWSRLRDGTTAIEAGGAKSLGSGDVISLGHEVIHSVLNPLPRHTAAIHVYGGDFFEQPRSEWESETLREEPYNVPRNMQRFEDSNLHHARVRQGRSVEGLHESPIE